MVFRISREYSSGTKSPPSIDTAIASSDILTPYFSYSFNNHDTGWQYYGMLGDRIPIY